MPRLPIRESPPAAPLLRGGRPRAAHPSVCPVPSAAPSSHQLRHSAAAELPASTAVAALDSDRTSQMWTQPSRPAVTAVEPAMPERKRTQDTWQGEEQRKDWGGDSAERVGVPGGEA